MSDKKVETFEVFVYGTLMNPSVRSALGLSEKQTKKVTLKDYKKVGLNIVESPGDKVQGEVFAVTEDELDILDGYESVESGLYEQIIVVINGKRYIAYQKCDENTVIFSGIANEAG